MLWVPKDGRPGIPLKALGDSHLENLIRYCERVAERAEERARMLMRQQEMWDPRNRGMRGIETRWLEMRNRERARTQEEFEWLMERDRARSRPPQQELPQEVADSLKNAKHWWLWHARFLDERHARENGAQVFPELAPANVDLDSDVNQGRRDVEIREFRGLPPTPEEARPGPITFRQEIVGMQMRDEMITVVVDEAAEEQIRRTLPPTRRIAAAARRLGRSFVTGKTEPAPRQREDDTTPPTGTRTSRKKTKDK